MSYINVSPSLGEAGAAVPSTAVEQGDPDTDREQFEHSLGEWLLREDFASVDPYQPEDVRSGRVVPLRRPLEHLPVAGEGDVLLSGIERRVPRDVADVRIRCPYRRSVYEPRFEATPA